MSGPQLVAVGWGGEWGVVVRSQMRLDVGGIADEKQIFDGDLMCMTKLSVHAAIGQASQLKMCLKTHGCPHVDMRDQDGDRAALHWAAARGRTRCAELLLEFGADHTLPDADGRTPLELAERYGHGTVAFVLRYGRPLKDPRCILEDSGITDASLHAALDQPGQLKHMLGRRSADPHARDADGDRTPLHWAAARGHVRCARVLLKAGASLDAPDSDGRTPEQLALTLRHAETYLLLVAVHEERTLCASSPDARTHMISVLKRRKGLFNSPRSPLGSIRERLASGRRSRDH